jgi:hypothetical protein
MDTRFSRFAPLLRDMTEDDATVSRKHIEIAYFPVKVKHFVSSVT